MEKKWLKPSEVMEQCNIKVADLLSYITEGLPVYDSGNPHNRLKLEEISGRLNLATSYTEGYSAHYVLSHGLCVFRVSDIKELIGEQSDKKWEAIDKTATIEHSDDFRSVTKNNETYNLTPTQAQIIQILYDIKDKGEGYKSQANILEYVESNSKSIKDLFKRTRAAFDALIEKHPTTQGLYRLKK